MPTDPFNQTQKGKLSFEQVAKNPETLSLDEAIHSISTSKQSPNYQTLRAVLLGLECVLLEQKKMIESQKQILRKMEELK